MVTLKRMEKRMNVVEEWVKDFEKGTGPAQTLDNLNWLVGQCRTMGAQMQQMSQQNQELMGQLQQNHQLYRSNKQLKALKSKMNLDLSFGRPCLRQENRFLRQ